MKISEVQAWLEAIKQEAGDVDVHLLDFSGYMEFKPFKINTQYDALIIDLTKWDDGVD